MEFLTVLFAIAGLVWLIPVVQNGRLIVIAMAVLGVGTVFGPDFFHIDGPIQLSLDRLLWFGMFAMAMVGWRMGYVQIPKLHRIDWIVVGIVGWTLISAISSEHQTSGTPPTARWLFYILMPSGMYAIARAIKIETTNRPPLTAASPAPSHIPFRKTLVIIPYASNRIIDHRSRATICS